MGWPAQPAEGYQAHEAYHVPQNDAPAEFANGNVQLYQAVAFPE